VSISPALSDAGSLLGAPAVPVDRDRSPVAVDDAVSAAVDTLMGGPGAGPSAKRAGEQHVSGGCGDAAAAARLGDDAPGAAWMPAHAGGGESPTGGARGGDDAAAAAAAAATDGGGCAPAAHTWLA